MTWNDLRLSLFTICYIQSVFCICGFQSLLVSYILAYIYLLTTWRCNFIVSTEVATIVSSLKYNVLRHEKKWKTPWVIIYILLFKRQNHKFLDIINCLNYHAYVLSLYREFIEVMKEMGQELWLTLTVKKTLVYGAENAS